MRRVYDKVETIGPAASFDVDGILYVVQFESEGKKRIRTQRRPHVGCVSFAFIDCTVHNTRNTEHSARLPYSTWLDGLTHLSRSRERKHLSVTLPTSLRAFETQWQQCRGDLSGHLNPPFLPSAASPDDYPTTSFTPPAFSSTCWAALFSGATQGKRLQSLPRLRLE
ncbi:hypothetical protein OUZ56_001851, partial [Daphnia magna]